MALAESSLLSRGIPFCCGIGDIKRRATCHFGCSTLVPLKSTRSACITLSGNPLPDAAPNQTSSPKPRRWTIVAAGFLLLALALVVIYTSRGAFLSPLAMVVVAAIGLAALLLQLRLHKDLTDQIHAPLWLNVLGLVFAVSAVIADLLHLHPNLLILAALGAVVCFAISGVRVLQSIRRQRK